MSKHDYDGSMVPFKRVLHLRTGLAYLENNNLLVARKFIDDPVFAGFNKIKSDEDESYLANCIWVNGKVLVPPGYEKTMEKTRKSGYAIIMVDTSEYGKIDGGLSCLS